MKLEQQVTSLELSQKLEKLGVKQESLFYWYINPWNEAVGLADKKEIKIRPELKEVFSAYTVAELGEMLKEGMLGSWKTYNKGWSCKYEYEDDDPEPIAEVGGGDTEANARAKMLIYLLENKLITL